MGTPMTGSVVCEATTPGSAAAPSRRRDEHLNSGIGSALHVLLDLLGVAVRGGHDELALDAKLIQRLLGIFHHRLIGGAANNDADLRHG